LWVDNDSVDGPDKLKVLITNPTGTVLATLAIFTNADASSSYHPESVTSMSDFIEISI